MSRWCTIESDPGVFRAIVERMGVQGVDVEEIYSMDQPPRSQSHGLVFLFKWRQETDDRPIIDPSDLPELFFAKQIVQDACATQAILSVLLNADNINIGSMLEDFKAFAGALDFESRGLAIGESDAIREAHNEFARAEPFFTDDSKPKPGEESEDVYHFIAYVPFRGSVYELDGLKAGPVFLGEIPEGEGANWWSVAKPAINARMNRYSASETHFALLTVCQSRAVLLGDDILRLRAQLEAADLNDDVRQGILSNVASLENDLSDERDRHEMQRQENLRRRHNFVPFIIELMKSLAAKGALQPLYDNAKRRRTGN